MIIRKNEQAGNVLFLTDGSPCNAVADPRKAQVDRLLAHRTKQFMGRGGRCYNLKTNMIFYTITKRKSK